MMDEDLCCLDGRARIPWNKGKLIGARPPLQPKHVWAIRTRLQIGGRTRDLALFNLAIDSKLRGCDLVSLRVVDVAPHGYAVDRTTIRQKKTGRPVRFEITEQTRQAVDDHLPRPSAQRMTTSSRAEEADIAQISRARSAEGAAEGRRTRVPQAGWSRGPRSEASGGGV